jgi:hypothetical protein
MYPRVRDIVLYLEGNKIVSLEGAKAEKNFA